MSKSQRAKILAYTRGLFNLFRNVMNYRNLRKIVCTQFDWISENYLENSVLTVNKFPAVYILSPALDGLWRENRGSLNIASTVLIVDMQHIMHPLDIISTIPK